MSALLVLACSACADGEDTTDTPPDGTADAGNGPPTPPPPLQGTPSSDEVTERFGIFVTTIGSTSHDADGTRAKPFTTITLGLERAKATGKRLYVCIGTFKEAITVFDGISMVGGFSCENGIWKREPNAAAKTRVESPTSPAVIAMGVNLPTRVEGFDIVAPAGTETNATSIGLHAKTSRGLTFALSAITAGRGRDGAPGVEGTQLTLGLSAAGGNGFDQRYVDMNIETPNQWRGGIAGGVGSCIGAPDHHGQSGGKGGQGATMHSSSGLTWTVHSSGSGATAVTYQATTGEVISGLNGGPGAHGASAQTPGVVTADGFIPSDGKPGANGAPGSGGDGGNGANLVALSAVPNGYAFGVVPSGGGAGGCPGLAGTAGKGGGASIGALLVQSSLVLDATTVNASEGGAGGRGAFGSSPTLGGVGGTMPTAIGTPGKPGQTGGRSGTSGSGAGGSSIAIAQSGGDAIVLKNGATTTVAVGGGSGVPVETKADAVGNQKTREASVDGERKAMHLF